MGTEGARELERNSPSLGKGKREETLEYLYIGSIL
jgi:hypothetical protein